MNIKRAKAIRQALRAHGINPADVQHIDGATIRLNPNCGRAVYRAAKVLGLNPFMRGAAA